MADSWDWLEGISGGFQGIVNGLTAGAKPFDAWEGVRTKDIANDRGELTNRDLELIQWARENAGYDYYGDQVGAADTGYRQKIASGDVDIFGNEQKLALQQYLADPTGAFQQGLKETGWEPGSPEYREWLAEAMAQFDPSGAVGAYDKMGIPGIQNRNLNEQASLAFLQTYIRQTGPDKSAEVVRLPDGTIGIMSNGELTPLPEEMAGSMLVKAASMLNAKNPEDAINAGIGTSIKIQNSNAALAKAMKDDPIAAAAMKGIENQRIGLNQALSGARQEYNTIIKSSDYTTATPEEREQLVGEVKQRIISLTKQQTENQQMYNSIVQRMSLPRMGMGGGAGGPGARVGPQGGASVTTRRPPGAAAARAAGMADVPWGRSSEGPAYPRQRVSPQDTGVRPITQGDAGGGLSPDIMAFLQLLGVA